MHILRHFRPLLRQHLHMVLYCKYATLSALPPCDSMLGRKRAEGTVIDPDVLTIGNCA